MFVALLFKSILKIPSPIKEEHDNFTHTIHMPECLFALLPL
jgi:hypothetical protein